jgi:glycosyltransferase involved in cell wall biosynthesis
MEHKQLKLAIVVPCYNEQEVFPDTKAALSIVLANLIQEKIVSENSYIVFVDDGSKDETWKLINKAHEESKSIRGLKLSRNRGHQNALLAGLMYAKDNADMAISIDADLQDDVNVIKELVLKHYQGNEMVFAVRAKRDKDSIFKRLTAQSFYRVMNLMGVKTIYNHADYRLMSKRTLNELSKYKEVNLFLRALVVELGFKTDVVYFDRLERLKGESKYPLKKMISFAIDGITSFSIKPLTIYFTLSFILLITGFIWLFVSLLVSLLTTIIWPLSYVYGLIILIGGINLLAISTVGQYVGKNYVETKARPRYIVETILE